MTRASVIACAGICLAAIGLAAAQAASAEPSVHDLAARTELRAIESLTLILQHIDGSITRGESPRDPQRALRGVSTEPAGVAAPRAVLRAIAKADLIVLSPRSLFTSTIPALLGEGTAEALARFRGPVSTRPTS